MTKASAQIGNLNKGRTYREMYDSKVVVWKNIFFWRIGLTDDYVQGNIT